MALISIGLAFSDTGTFELPFKAEYSRRYIARSNNPFDSPLSVVRDRLCPKPGQRDPIDPRAWITSVQAERRDGTDLVWDITVSSTTEFDPDDDENPLIRPAKITPASEQVVTTTRKNARGQWIRNTAGTVIPLEKKQSLWIFNVEKNVPFIPAAVMEMNEKVNSGSVFLRGLLVARHKLMVSGIRGEEQEARVRDQRLRYVTMFFQLHYNRSGYKVKYPNVDLVELAAEKLVPQRDARGRIVRVNRQLQYQRLRNARTPILDAESHPVTEPWPLDRQGRALPRDYRESQLIELEEEIYEQTSFDVLPLR
jgi:hypothetical protein